MGITIDKHGKMPDLIISLPVKKWLVLIEAVTSHGPMNLKRHNELQELFGSGSYGLIFITAFETRKVMHKYLSEIAWETEVWVSESPSHLIHFDGERFLGPYSD
jgi:adenine-specific DNA-methyltransferase